LSGSLFGDEVAHWAFGLDPACRPVTVGARRGTHDPSFDEFGESVARRVEGQEPSNGATPVGDDQLVAGAAALDVSAEAGLLLSDPYLGPRCGYIHD
jgi:hypothetical protein